MRFGMAKTSTAVYAVWLGILLGVLAFFLARLGVPGAVPATATVYALLMGLLWLRVKDAAVRVTHHEFYVSRGIVFRQETRMALRLVNGTVILRTPLQRVTGTCFLLVISAGATVCVCGLHTKDAEEVRRLVTGEESV